MKLCEHKKQKFKFTFAWENVTRKLAQHPLLNARSMKTCIAECIFQNIFLPFRSGGRPRAWYCGWGLPGDEGNDKSQNNFLLVISFSLFCHFTYVKAFSLVFFHRLLFFSDSSSQNAVIDPRVQQIERGYLRCCNNKIGFFLSRNFR